MSCWQHTQVILASSMVFRLALWNYIDIGHKPYRPQRYRPHRRPYRPQAKSISATAHRSISATRYRPQTFRRGPHIASHSVCPSVCPSVPLLLPSVTSRHLANYNDPRAEGRISYGHLGRTSLLLLCGPPP